MFGWILETCGIGGGSKTDGKAWSRLGDVVTLFMPKMSQTGDVEAKALALVGAEKVFGLKEVKGFPVSVRLAKALGVKVGLDWAMDEELKREFGGVAGTDPQDCWDVP